MLDMKEVRALRKRTILRDAKTELIDDHIMGVAIAVCIELLSPSDRSHEIELITAALDAQAKEWQAYLDEKKEEFMKAVGSGGDNDLVMRYRSITEQLMYLKLYRLDFEAHLPKTISPMRQDLHAACGNPIFMSCLRRTLCKALPGHHETLDTVSPEDLITIVLSLAELTDTARANPLPSRIERPIYSRRSGTIGGVIGNAANGYSLRIDLPVDRCDWIIGINRFAEGITPHTHVAEGDLIGYYTVDVKV